MTTVVQIPLRPISPQSITVQGEILSADLNAEGDLVLNVLLNTGASLDSRIVEFICTGGSMITTPRRYLGTVHSGHTALHVFERVKE